MPRRPNRLNRERRSYGASDRKKLARAEKKIEGAVTTIQGGGYARGMVDRLRDLEAKQDQPTERLSAVPPELSGIHPTSQEIRPASYRPMAQAPRRGFRKAPPCCPQTSRLAGPVGS